MGVVVALCQLLSRGSLFSMMYPSTGAPLSMGGGVHENSRRSGSKVLTVSGPGVAGTSVIVVKIKAILCKVLQQVVDILRT